MAQPLMTRIKSFCTQQANAPVVALSLVLEAAEHMVQHRDWDAMSYLIGHMPSNFSRKTRAICGQIFKGVAFDDKSPLAKAHPNKCRFTLAAGKEFGFTDKIGALRKLVKDGTGITSKDIAEVLAIPVKTVEYDQAKYVNSVAKKAVENKVDLDVLFAEIREAVRVLQAEEAVTKLTEAA